MKKACIALIAILLCAGVLAGCADGQKQRAGAGSSVTSAGKTSIVCDTFPAYDWVRQIVGDASDAYEVTYLMGTGTDLHSFQPTVDDIAKIASADLFIYVGGESDEWAKDAVKAASNPNLRTVNMMEVMGDAAVEEEVVEGMQADEGHEHHDGESHEADSEDGAEHKDDEGHHEGAEEHEYDEHVWLSLRNAQVLVSAIADQIAAIDPKNAAAYASNAKAYNDGLSQLDKRYAQAVSAAAHDTVVFADRFPFRYLVDDYGLSYYAAFVGCSAETEASFETVAFLAKKVDELGLSSVLVIEGSDQKIAETVVRSTQAKDQAILAMDSLQSVTDADVAAGKSYVGAMEENLSTLTKALA